MVKELEPVVGTLMDSGRNAYEIGSELGSMQVTDQIDAMRPLGTDPIRKLLTPYVHVAVIMLLCVAILFGAVGIVGGNRLGISARARCS